MKTTINKEQKLYVINNGNGYSCLGFDVCKERAERLNTELNTNMKLAKAGTTKLYDQYTDLVEIARRRNIENGWRSKSELNESFTGYYESKQRVVVSFRDSNGKEYETQRGRIGKTTGFIPCYLLMLRSNSTGSSYTIGKNDRVLRVV